MWPGLLLPGGGRGHGLTHFGEPPASPRCAESARLRANAAAVWRGIGSESQFELVGCGHKMPLFRCPACGQAMAGELTKGKVEILKAETLKQAGIGC